jgi:hypothetical protein
VWCLRGKATMCRYAVPSTARTADPAGRIMITPGPQILPQQYAPVARSALPEDFPGRPTVESVVLLLRYYPRPGTWRRHPWGKPSAVPAGPCPRYGAHHPPSTSIVGPHPQQPGAVRPHSARTRIDENPLR